MFDTKGASVNKWLSNIITTLVVLAMTSLVGALLKGPIDDLSSRNRLKAQVQLAPWINKPEKPSQTSKSDDNPKTDKEILDNLLKDLSNIPYTVSSSDSFGVARTNIENDGSKVVTDINLRLDSPYGKEESVLIYNGKMENLGEVDRISIPDMKPGDRVTIYMWGNFSSLILPDSIKTYSSEGSFRISYDWPQTQEFEYKSKISIFIDEWAESLGGFSIILLTVILGIYVGVFSDYVKNLFKSQASYESERERFLSDPKSFSPNIVGVEAAAKIASLEQKNEEKIGAEKP